MANSQPLDSLIKEAGRLIDQCSDITPYDGKCLPVAQLTSIEDNIVGLLVALKQTIEQLKLSESRLLASIEREEHKGNI